MGWSVVAENGSYNWTQGIKRTAERPNSGDKTEPELSQHYRHKTKAFDMKIPDLPTVQN
jgi:hypothetical protein